VLPAAGTLPRASVLPAAGVLLAVAVGNDVGNDVGMKVAEDTAVPVTLGSGCRAIFGVGETATLQAVTATSAVVKKNARHSLAK
jgi:hypothetical protein